MTGAGADDANFGAARGSGTESDGKGAASPREAPSEAHAASGQVTNKAHYKPAHSKSTMAGGVRFRHYDNRIAKCEGGVQQHKNTARISTSPKIQRLLI